MSVEQKWLDQDGGAPFVETRKTPDIESMDLEQYQQSIAQYVPVFLFLSSFISFADY